MIIFKANYMTRLLSRFRSAVLLVLAGTVLTATAATSSHRTPKYRINLPPSAVLDYTIRARQSGLQIGGDASVRWNVQGKTFSAASEARAMLVGTILEATSKGAIDQYGLAPHSFVQKRFRKETTTTTFDRAAGVIRFTGSDRTYPINGGEQDRNSVIWQLIAVARAAPVRFKPGSSWAFFVAGQHDADPWTFRVVGHDRLATPLGELDTLHVLKEPPPDSRDQRVDIWLAPQREWYPVRLRYTDADGDYIEQTLQEIERRAH